MLSNKVYIMLSHRLPWCSGHQKGDCAEYLKTPKLAHSSGTVASKLFTITFQFLFLTFKPNLPDAPRSSKCVHEIESSYKVTNSWDHIRSSWSFLSFIFSDVISFYMFNECITIGHTFEPTNNDCKALQKLQQIVFESMLCKLSPKKIPQHVKILE